MADVEQGKGQIYFIADDDSNAVKIGIADFPEWRMNDMQVGNPHKLRLAKTIPNGNHKLEKELHRIFSDYALGHEWFRLTDEIKEFLGEKKNKSEIQLDEEFRNFFPPLSDEQKTGLEQDILAHGCLAPLVLWGNTLIDGYHRYDICHEHGTPFQVVSFNFGNKLEAMYWLLAHQKNRRNLSKYELASRALALRPIIEEKARGRRQQAGELYHKGSPKVFPNRENLCIHTDEELAKLAGVSQDTIYKVETILESADQKTKERLGKGEITINKAYKEAKQQQIIKPTKPTEPPEGAFSVIVIDPPWPYEKRAGDPTHRGRLPYPSMSLEEIKQLNVPATGDCILWLWTTNAFMHDAFHVLEAWQFTPKTILTWVKDKIGLGDWLRGQTEHCILAIKGHPTIELTNQSTVIYGALREHSRKPDEFYQMVECLCPGRKLEMFARTKRQDWASHGNETEHFQ